MQRNLLQFLANGLLTVAIVSLFMGFSAVGADGDDTSRLSSVPEVISADFTYQGYLELNSTPVTDSCDMRFSFYSVATGGSLLATAQNRNNVPVSDGLFAVSLAAGTLFQNEARYIEIAVDCGTGLITLSPRQQITAAPYAHTLRPGATVAGLDSGNAVNLQSGSGTFSDGLSINSIDGDDGVQIASGDDGVYITQAGDDAIHIEAATGDGLFVESAGASGVNVSAAQRHGVYGRTSNNAYYGGAFINNGSTSGNGVGLYARANRGDTPDIIVGGNDGGSSGDDGIISSDPAYAGSDLFIDANDAVVVRLDRDESGDDADFSVEDNAGKNLFNIDESGAVWADYNGTLDYALPHALAYIDADGSINHATATIEDASWVTSVNRYRVNLAIPCSEAPFPRALVIMVTPEENELQAGANAFDCVDDKVALRVYFENNFGINQQTSFHLLVYRLRD